MLLLLIVGGLLALVGWVWILITAFSESVPFAVAIFFIPFVAVIYGYLHWEDLKVPTVMYFVGAIAFLVGRYS